VARAWRRNASPHRIGLDPKTVRRYLAAAATAGVRVTATISDEEVRQVLLALHPAGGRPRGDGWARCLEQRSAIERWLADGIRLTKIRKLLVRQGVEIASDAAPLAVLELQFGKTATTIPVLDGEPGQELQLDTGRVGWLTLPEHQRTVSGVDLHRRALAASLRLSHLRGNDGPRD
jgi:hypothetical protein